MLILHHGFKPFRSCHVSRTNQAHGTLNFKSSNDGVDDKALLAAPVSERLSGEEACNPFRFSANHQPSLKMARDETSNDGAILGKSSEAARCASHLHLYAGFTSSSKSQADRQIRLRMLMIISVIQQSSFPQLHSRQRLPCSPVREGPTLIWVMSPVQEDKLIVLLCERVNQFSDTHLGLLSSARG